MAPAHRWWRDPGALRRFVADLLTGDLARQRHGSVPAPSTWTDALDFTSDLGVDSLELLGLGTALNEALQLHASGVEDYLLTRRTLGDWLEICTAGLELRSDRMTFRTSGSTGAALACQQDTADLLQEVEVLAGLFVRRKRVLLAVPSHHIYGFIFGVLLPWRLGVAETNVVDLRPHTPGWLAAHARPGDLVVAHPGYWDAVARCGAPLAAGAIGVTSTAPCPDHVAHALQSLGLERLVQVYGASELAGVGWRDEPGAPYQLMPHWQLVDDGARLLRTQADGRQVRREAPDHLRPAGPGLVTVGERRDGAVQVGGTNVFPARVRDVLRRHPAVADVAVRLMAPNEGTRLKAFVVPRSVETDELALKMELSEWIVSALDVPERPKAITVGAALPRSASGKPADWPCDR
jgi:long-chain acyl-CoA synthetase